MIIKIKQGGSPLHTITVISLDAKEGIHGVSVVLIDSLGWTIMVPANCPAASCCLPDGGLSGAGTSCLNVTSGQEGTGGISRLCFKEFQCLSLQAPVTQHVMGQVADV